MRRYIGSAMVQIMACHLFGTNPLSLTIGPLGANFNEISIKIQNFSFSEMHLKISSVKWRPFCPGGGDELTRKQLQTRGGLITRKATLWFMSPWYWNTTLSEIKILNEHILPHKDFIEMVTFNQNTLRIIIHLRHPIAYGLKRARQLYTCVYAFYTIHFQNSYSPRSTELTFRSPLL